MKSNDKGRFVRLSDEEAANSGGNVSWLAGQRAFERLDLRCKDILLNLGTCGGEFIVAAASACRHVIGIDTSAASVKRWCEQAVREGIDNVIFAFGTLEELSSELELASCGVTKILAIYALHHLPDPLKKENINALAHIVRRPGRMVIGDLMFFEDPEKYRREFSAVGYDDGYTDFPSNVEYLIDCLEQEGGIVQVEQIHPLVGILVADFLT